MSPCVALDEAGIDRGREARIVQLHGGIGPVLAADLLPGCAEIETVFLAVDAEVGRLVAIFPTRRMSTGIVNARVLSVPVKPESWVLKVPMMAMFHSFLGYEYHAYRGLDACRQDES